MYKQVRMDNVKDGLEIERKFLLNQLPYVPNGYNEVLSIQQHYFINSEGIWERIRCSSATKTPPPNTTLTHTIKHFISEGIHREIEREITDDEWNEYIRIYENTSKSRVLSKTRHIFKVGDLKWEIDTFPLKSLVIAEVELPSEDYNLELPDFIKENLVMEVTKFKEFSSLSLADECMW